MTIFPSKPAGRVGGQAVLSRRRLNTMYEKLTLNNWKFRNGPRVSGLCSQGATCYNDIVLKVKLFICLKSLHLKQRFSYSSSNRVRKILTFPRSAYIVKGRDTLASTSVAQRRENLGTRLFWHELLPHLSNLGQAKT